MPIRVGNRLLKLADLATIHRGYEDPPGSLVRSRGLMRCCWGRDAERPERAGFGLRLSGFSGQRTGEPAAGDGLDVLTDQTEAIQARLTCSSSSSGRSGGGGRRQRAAIGPCMPGLIVGIAACR